MRVLVLGASGFIGTMITQNLLSSGHIVTASYHSCPENLYPLCERYLGKLELFYLELGEIGTVKKVMCDVLQEYGGAEALVNALDVGGNPEFLIRLSLDRMSHVVAVNLTGVILATQVAVLFLIKNSASAVVILSSVAATAPTPGVTAYAAVKAGIEGFSKALAVVSSMEAVDSLLSASDLASLLPR